MHIDIQATMLLGVRGQLYILFEYNFFLYFKKCIFFLYKFCFFREPWLIPLGKEHKIVFSIFLFLEKTEGAFFDPLVFCMAFSLFYIGGAPVFE